MNDNEPTVLMADGFDDALIGIGQQFSTYLAVYDYDKCVEVLMTRDGMSRDDAIEFMEVNVVGSFVGPRTPVFVAWRRNEE
jgi:hypothetical protein